MRTRAKRAKRKFYPGDVVTLSPEAKKELGSFLKKESYIILRHSNYTGTHDELWVIAADDGERDIHADHLTLIHRPQP